jgi:hypothetical protein
VTKVIPNKLIQNHLSLCLQPFSPNFIWISQNFLAFLFCFCFFLVLGNELGASCMLGKHSTTELHLQPIDSVFLTTSQLNNERW